MNSIRQLRAPFHKWINQWIKPEPLKPLGRWGLGGDSYLKADYANMDSCGDVLCGKPDYFKTTAGNAPEHTPPRSFEVK